MSFNRISTFLVSILVAAVRLDAFYDGDSSAVCDGNSQRQMRGIVWPPYTVLQFAVGLAVPAQVPNRTIMTNWGTLNNVPLPSKVQQLYLTSKERRGKIRKYTHQDFYSFLEKAFTAWSSDITSGRDQQRQQTKSLEQSATHCVLRSICLASGLGGYRKQEFIYQLIQLLFSPSKIGYSTTEMPYLIAERIGQRSPPNQRIRDCYQAYPMCFKSIFEAIFQNVQLLSG